MSREHSFDPKCLELASHFLPPDVRKDFLDDLAQAIQEAVESWRCPDDEHDWEYVRDWEGDPNVINGTHDISYKHCRTCYADEAWDGVPDEPDPDWERDQALDDKALGIGWTEDSQS